MNGTFDRVARLEDLRADLTGWGYIDIGRLLDAWGCKSMSLGVSYGVEQLLWYHESEPARLNVVVPSVDGIVVSTVEQVIWLVDEINRLGL